jgi:Thioredoxin-like domain
MMMSMQFGMPPSVRRNLFTILAVMDPIRDASNMGWTVFAQLMQRQFPVRIGILLVSTEDVENCQEWLQAQESKEGDCPVPPLFDPASAPDLPDTKKIPATTRMVHRLVSSFALSHESLPGALIAYVQYMIQEIQDQQASLGDLSLFDLITIHGNLLQGMELDRMDRAVDKALKDLTAATDETTELPYHYERAVRFAVAKGMIPGFSFLNGRALPTTEDSAAFSEVFSDEQRFIFQMIMKRDITDSSPRSVYAMLLRGKGVFAKCHPLLLSSSTSSSAYRFISHSFDADSLLVARPPAETASQRSVMVIEAFVDFSSSKGLAVAKGFVDALDSASLWEKGCHLAGRVIPRTKEAAESGLCSVLANAGRIGYSVVRNALDRFEPSMELEAFLAEVTTLTDNDRHIILASALNGPCSSVSFLEQDSSFFVEDSIVANGRVYHLNGGTVSTDDTDLLYELESDRAKAVLDALHEWAVLDSPSGLDALSRAASFLAHVENEFPGDRTDPLDAISKITSDLELESNPLVFEWNGRKTEPAPLTVRLVSPWNVACLTSPHAVYCFARQMSLPSWTRRLKQPRK